MPRLYSYVVKWDTGFAPNPFYGFCTLATCKPQIRKTACPGDWILGTVSKSTSPDPRLIYAMRVTETLSYNEYWCDARFRKKRPDIGAACGDNMYYRNADGQWHQAPGYHGPDAIGHDTQTDRVLVSDDFIYWGSAAPFLPLFAEMDVRAGRGHKCHFPDETIQAFIAWFRACQDRGHIGRCGQPTRGPSENWPGDTENGMAPDPQPAPSGPTSGLSGAACRTESSAVQDAQPAPCATRPLDKRDACGAGNDAPARCSSTRTPACSPQKTRPSSCSSARNRDSCRRS